MDTAKPIHVGVAGWSYEDWQDTVYKLPTPGQQLDLFGPPRPAPARYARDKLAFIAQYIDMMEVNSSFYRIPNPRTTESWGQRVGQKREFFFTAKLHQSFTHEFRRDRALARTFRDAFAPLAGSRKLAALLAQFRYDFRDAPESRQLLTWIHSQFASFAPLIVEVRHSSWEEPAALAFLRDLRVVVANLDYPTAVNSFNPYACAIGDAAYLRLHGRNRKAWFSREADVNQTYNYDYSDSEVKELVERSRTILGNVKQLTIVANNHYQGKAVSAAVRIKAELARERVPVPPALVETYPNLRRIARGNS